MQQKQENTAEHWSALTKNERPRTPAAKGATTQKKKCIQQHRMIKDYGPQENSDRRDPFHKNVVKRKKANRVE